MEESRDYCSYNDNSQIHHKNPTSQGNSSSPSSSCCSQLSNVVHSQPQCLCLLLNGTASSYGFNVHQTLALGLPGVCNVQTPPVSRCSEGNQPTPSPSTPESPPVDSWSGSNIPSGSKRVPSDNSNNVGGSNIKAPSNVVVFLFFIASYTLSVTGF